MDKFLSIALKEAVNAKTQGEVPVGACIVKDGRVIAKGHNEREKKQIATRHAEIVAIEKACKKLGSWRLDGCVLYVTVEPCVMCFGAILNARIEKVCYGAEAFNGGCGGVLSEINGLSNWKTEVVYLREEACSDILSSFFKERRK